MHLLLIFVLLKYWSQVKKLVEGTLFGSQDYATSSKADNSDGSSNWKWQRKLNGDVVSIWSGDSSDAGNLAHLWPNCLSTWNLPEYHFVCRF
jgi:hypothetical protein